MSGKQIACWIVTAVLFCIMLASGGFGVVTVLCEGINLLGMIFWCAVLIGGFMASAALLIYVVEGSDGESRVITASIQLAMAYLSIVLIVGEYYT